ncbi:MAG TPA: hypothetical protein VK021_01350 [Flavobacteriaceae bacterium]|nr:hypothetical protein [Flavobacteriaceae bacterium]
MKTIFTSKIFFIASFLWLTGCSTDDTALEPQVENKLEINIDQSEYISINEEVYGNENCEKLYVNANYYDQNEINFSIYFTISKDGNLLRVRYDEKPQSGSEITKNFLTPNFNPLSTFNISNFHYNSTTGEVKFNFSGKVFYDNDNEIARNISGKYRVNTLINTECSVPNTGLYYDSEDLKLVSYSIDITKHINHTQTHKFFSNNGFAIYLHVAQDLWFYPLGEITINENNSTDSVAFKQAIGPIIADQVQNINDQEWKDYETSGKIIIENKYIEKNKKMISGKLNLLIKDNGQEVYSLNGIEFKTLSLEE